jgi:cell wall-associated NlpC family hydrolase
VPDGRLHSHARVAAAVTATLTTIGLGLATASPASASPATDTIETVQARVDHLSQQVQAAGKRHDKAQNALTGTRTQLGRVTAGIQRHRQILDTLRTQVARTVVNEYGDGYAAGAGTSAPASPATRLSEDSKVLLTNLTLVSEDAGARGDAMASSNAQLQKLGQRRDALRGKVTVLAGRERSLRTQEQRVDTRAAAAGATLARLEEKAAAERLQQLGGPVLAFAKSQVGKAYVYGAAGPSAFDCSGLTMAAWSQSGVSLPHNAAAQYSSGTPISESELQPGDLVFYYTPISHVGLYIGNGQIVNALNPGAGVLISGLHDMPYVGAVRPG